MVNEQMVNLMIMKKLYIQPNSNVQSVNLIGTICVGSIHGDSELEYGGGNTYTPGGSVKPM